MDKKKIWIIIGVVITLIIIAFFTRSRPLKNSVNKDTTNNVQSYAVYGVEDLYCVPIDQQNTLKKEISDYIVNNGVELIDDIALMDEAEYCGDGVYVFYFFVKGVEKNQYLKCTYNVKEKTHFLEFQNNINIKATPLNEDADYQEAPGEELVDDVVIIDNMDIVNRHLNSELKARLIKELSAFLKKDYELRRQLHVKENSLKQTTNGCTFILVFKTPRSDGLNISVDYQPGMGFTVKFI